MNEIERMIQELEQEQVKAGETKEEAARKEKELKAALKELQAAKAHADKAKAAYYVPTEEVNEVEEEHKVIFNGGIVREPKEQTEEESEDEYVKRTNDFGSGLIIGAAAVALIATGTWALSKDPITGEVRATTWFNRNNRSVNTEDTVLENGDKELTYDYDNNEVVIVAEEGHTYDFENNGSTHSIIAEDYEYEELTDEEFNKLTASVIKEFEEIGLQVTREDVIKYVMIRNIDKLRQDNNELISSIVGTQDIFEVITDACHVFDAIRNYNLPYFEKYHTTDGFISATIGIFDKSQKARAAEVERRVYEIGKYYQDEEKYNELTYILLRDLYNPENEISGLEDGVSYGVLSIDIYMLRTCFGTNRYISLDETNADLIKYFVSFPEDDAEHTNNALMNGNISNIVRLLAECETKTRTK